ncbi:hypothetical protein RIF29_39283 [Crotalaria pallida]|uniref:Uncharacterized protein n=1 Tax=Crotalaria pallida TaxID=3830 RepID=A0AAN9E1S7_CROPI
MLALSPPVSSSMGIWPLEVEPIISHNNNQTYYFTSDYYCFLWQIKRLNENEAAIQISTYEEVNNISLSEILLCFENHGFVLLNASSSETVGGRIFYNLHFQVEKTYRLESEMLLSMLEKKEGIF